MPCADLVEGPFGRQLRTIDKTLVAPTRLQASWSRPQMPRYLGEYEMNIRTGGVRPWRCMPPADASGDGGDGCQLEGEGDRIGARRWAQD
jgi:hypothetical protein